MFAARADQHRGHALIVEHPLFADGRREAEVGELPERARRTGIPPGLVLDRIGDGALQRERRRAETVGVGHDERAAQMGAGEVAEHDRGVEGAVQPGCFEAFGERRRTGITAAAAGRRDEHDRALGLPRGEHAGELEQRAVPDSSPAGARGRGVAMGEHTIGAALVEPGRTAITVLSRRCPSIVCPSTWRTCTEKPPPAVPPRPRSVEAM